MPEARSEAVVIPRMRGGPGQGRLFRHVLACLDRSPHAQAILAQAAAFADLSDAKLTVLRVLPGATAARSCADPVDWELTRREELADIQRIADAIGATAQLEAVVVCGDTARCIEDEAQRRCVDLLVIGAGAFGTPGHWGLGGTARHLAESFAGSVLLVPQSLAGLPPAQRRVIVPVDGSQPAEAALGYATAIARDCEAEMVVLHALPEIGSTQDAHPGRDGSPLWSALRREAERMAEARLERLRRLLPIDGRQHRVRRLDGDEPRRALARAIAEERAGLVVLSARGQGQDPDLPIGSTADYLLARATSPVLLIRTAEAGHHRKGADAPRRLAMARPAG